MWCTFVTLVFMWCENPCELAYILDTGGRMSANRIQVSVEVHVTNTFSYTNLTSTGQLQYTWINKPESMKKIS